MVATPKYDDLPLSPKNVLSYDFGDKGVLKETLKTLDKALSDITDRHTDFIKEQITLCEGRISALRMVSDKFQKSQGLVAKDADTAKETRKLVKASKDACETDKQNYASAVSGFEKIDTKHKGIHTNARSELKDRQTAIAGTVKRNEALRATVILLETQASALFKQIAANAHVYEKDGAAEATIEKKAKAIFDKSDKIPGLIETNSKTTTATLTSIATAITAKKIDSKTVNALLADLTSNLKESAQLLAAARSVSESLMTLQDTLKDKKSETGKRVVQMATTRLKDKNAAGKLRDSLESQHGKVEKVWPALQSKAPELANFPAC